MMLGSEALQKWNLETLRAEAWKPTLWTGLTLTLTVWFDNMKETCWDGFYHVKQKYKQQMKLA